MPKKSSRRDFLRGKAAARALADAAQATLGDDAVANTPQGDDESPKDPRQQDYLLRISRRAMACRFEVCLNAGQYPHGMDAALEALDLIDSLENRLSVFRDDSELSEINRFAAERPVKPSEDVFRLLAEAAELYSQTDGAFDISAAPLWDVWGFSRRQGRIPGDGELAAAMELVGMENVVLDRREQTVAFSRPGVCLNLGAIAKGYALDRCAEVFATAGIDDFIIHGGQSSVLARGASMAEKKSTWSVGLIDPLSSGKRLAEIRLQDRSLATSSSAKQFFYHKGQRYSHILDPRSGRPAQGVLSATVLAPTAAEADALSTAAFVLGPDRAGELFSARPDLGMLFVLADRGGNRGEIISFGLAEADFRIA